jgi:hypothetical protein
LKLDRDPDGRVLAVSGPPTFDKKVSGVGFSFNVRYRPFAADQASFDWPVSAALQTITRIETEEH